MPSLNLHPNPTNGNSDTNGNNGNGNGTTSSESAQFYYSSVELADLGRSRFDQDVAGAGDRDYALNTARLVMAPTARAPRGMESAVHAWTTFQYTTDEVNATEELKGDLHGGQLHRENRMAGMGQTGMPQMGRGSSWGSAGGGGSSRGGGNIGGGGGRGGRNGVREEVQNEGLCAGRKPDVDAPPLAKGMAEEMDKSMFWDEPIV